MPGIIDRNVNVDKWMKTNDKESFQYAREIVTQEGLLTGGSCGIVIEGAFRYIKEHNL